MFQLCQRKENKRQINSAQLVKMLEEIIKNLDKNEVTVVVENVSAMPGQGVTSMFNLARPWSYKGNLCSFEFTHLFCKTSKWKKHFDLINSSKDASRTKAIELYPTISDKLSKKKM